MPKEVMCVPVSELKALVQRWRSETRKCIPREYAERGLERKYLALDNWATGVDDAADALDELIKAAQPADSPDAPHGAPSP